MGAPEPVGGGAGTRFHASRCGCWGGGVRVRRIELLSGWACLCCSDGHRPSCGGSAQVEDGHACEVDRGGPQPEVGGDAGRAADPGSAPAVAAAHEVAELALDLGAGAAVNGLALGRSSERSLGRFRR